MEKFKEYCEDEDGIVDKILSIAEPNKRYRSTRFFPFIGNTKKFLKVHIATPAPQSARLLFNKLLTRDRHAEVRKIAKAEKTIQTERIAVINKDDKIKLNCDDLTMLKSSPYPVGYALLGVVKQKMTKPEFVIQQHNLMFENPKEKLKYFNSFWKYCYEKDRVLFCSYKPTRASHASFCEMIAKVYNNRPGFLIKYLYFVDDIIIDPEAPFEKREEEVDEPDDSVINDVNKLIDALTFTFDPKAFFDVQDAKEEAYVRAQVLDQPMERVENFLDNAGNMNKILQDIGIVQKRKIDKKETKTKREKKSQ